MIENQVVGQILGFVSFALGIYAFYQKDDRKLKIFMFLFGITHAIHYLFLGFYYSDCFSQHDLLTSKYVSSYHENRPGGIRGAFK